MWVFTDQTLIIFGPHLRLFGRFSFFHDAFVFLSLRFNFEVIFLIVELSYHNLWDWTDVLHRRINFFEFSPQPELMFGRGRILRLRDDTAIGKRWISELLFHVFFVIFPLWSLHFCVDWVPVIMVFESEDWSAKELFSFVKISELFMRG